MTITTYEATAMTTGRIKHYSGLDGIFSEKGNSGLIEIGTKTGIILGSMTLSKVNNKFVIKKTSGILASRSFSFIRKEVKSLLNELNNNKGKLFKQQAAQGLSYQGSINWPRG